MPSFTTLGIWTNLAIQNTILGRSWVLIGSWGRSVFWVNRWFFELSGLVFLRSPWDVCLLNVINFRHPAVFFRRLPFNFFTLILWSGFNTRWVTSDNLFVITNRFLLLSISRQLLRCLRSCRIWSKNFGSLLTCIFINYFLGLFSLLLSLLFRFESLLFSLPAWLAFLEVFNALLAVAAIERFGIIFSYLFL